MKLFLYVLTQVCITLVSVCGIYILTGLTGMFSLGSAAFMAIGAYVSGLLVFGTHPFCTHITHFYPTERCQSNIIVERVVFFAKVKETRVGHHGLVKEMCSDEGITLVVHLS